MFPSQTLRQTFQTSILLFLTLTLVAGCGGGPVPPPMPGGGGNDGLESHNYTKSAYQSPNYHPHESYSHAYLWSQGDGTTAVYIGGDLEPRENLRQVGAENGFTYYMGASRDGVGIDRILNYEKDLLTKNGTALTQTADGFYPFRVKPRILIGAGFEDTKSPLAHALGDSIRILNDVLPPEFQLYIGGDYHGGATLEGDIVVAALPPVQIQTPNFCGSGSVACAANFFDGPIGSRWTRNAWVFLPDDLDTDQYMATRTVIVHELLHALGIQGHVDSIEFPDSLMGTAGDFFPNPGFTISRIDREVLQIMYMQQRTARYNDLTEWSDTTHHLVGRSDDGDVHFGVALFNGLPQPWARGQFPDTLLMDNRKLRGRVSWEGLLLGFSGVSPIAGDVRLEVMLSRLAAPQDLKFRDIYFVNRFESEGPDRWFPNRNLDYKVDVVGNEFGHSSSKGQIRGAFLGSEHEGMAGTIKRTDLVGAFGGTRP